MGLQFLWSAVLPLSGQMIPTQALSGYSNPSRACEDPAAQDLPVCQQATSALASQGEDSAGSDNNSTTLKNLSSRLPKDYNSQLLGPAIGKPLSTRKQFESPDDCLDATRLESTAFV